jgi:hypothetical protein
MKMEVILLGMASPRTYECFVCKRNGIDGVQLYLNGKDAEGRTKYLNEEMTIHFHQGSGAAPSPTQLPANSKQVSKEEIVPLLRIINTKLDRLLSKTGSGEKHHEEKETDGLLIE